MGHYSSKNLETKGPENIKIIHTLNLKREKIGEIFTNVFMLPYFCFFFHIAKQISSGWPSG